nr:enhanced disease susceptibility 1 protein [Tanacetum cinerariifolium]
MSSLCYVSSVTIIPPSHLLHVFTHYHSLAYLTASLSSYLQSRGSSYTQKVPVVFSERRHRIADSRIKMEKKNHADTHRGTSRLKQDGSTTEDDDMEQMRDEFSEGIGAAEEERVEKTIKEGKTVIFTGHSSGGTLLLLAAVWYLEKKVEKTIKEGKTVIFTGHSSGGALLLLAAVWSGGKGALVMDGGAGAI